MSIQSRLHRTLLNLLSCIEYKRQQQFNFCPWIFFEKANWMERKIQLIYQKIIMDEIGIILGEGCYVATNACFSPFERGDIQIGNQCMIAANVIVSGRVSMGDRCSLNAGSSLRHNVTLGNGVRIGANSSIIGFEHGFSNIEIDIYLQPLSSKGVVVANDVWVGNNVVITDGINVDAHAIVGAGSVVTKPVSAWSIVAGNPAKVIKSRRA